MTTRPGYVWDNTASEWVEIGQAAVVSPFKYQATAPSSPATGDIWIESDVDVPSVDSAQFLRWRKTMAGGETSLSGNDDSSLPLGYTPGYEQLYINGVLMVRGVDYTATDGTTVTGLTALVADDVVEVFSTLARSVADVYTQTQSDTKYGIIGTSAPFAMSAGICNCVFSASATSTPLVVNFPTGRFTQAPVVTAMVNTAAGSMIGSTIRIHTVTATSFTIIVSATASLSTTVNVMWQAAQMTSSAYVTGTAQ
jgi:hypothetical protein